MYIEAKCTIFREIFVHVLSFHCFYASFQACLIRYEIFMFIKSKLYEINFSNLKIIIEVTALPRAIFININIKIMLDFKLSPILNVRGISVIKINI